MELNIYTYKTEWNKRSSAEKPKVTTYKNVWHYSIHFPFKEPMLIIHLKNKAGEQSKVIELTLDPDRHFIASWDF